jgi:outer membrane protein assembly factor BamB
VLLALTLLALGLVQARSETDRNIRAWITSAIVLLGGGAQLLWLLLFSRLPGWRRLAAVVIVAGLGLGFKAVTRVEGTVSGTGLPRFVWRWTPTADQRLAHVSTSGPPAKPAAISPAEARFRFPQFLGPERAGRMDEVKLARDWSTQPPKELWRRPIGLGWSGFVVAEGLAFTQEQRGDEELVTAYTLTGGEPVWAHTNRVRFHEWQGGDGPRATPTLVGNRLYAFGATGLLDCLELATGRLLWSVDVLATNHLDNLTWGKSSSPLVTDGRVIVSGGTGAVRGGLAYDAATGQPLWSDHGDAATYASPAVGNLAGRAQILVNGARAVAGLDPQTGTRLWEFAWGNEQWPKCSQPLVVSSNHVFVSAGYSMGCLLLEVKAGADGTLAATEVWRGRSMKTQFNNVAQRAGHLYGLDDGFLACVDLATGKRLWKDGRYGSGQSLLVNELVLIQSEPGFVALAEAKPEGYTELGRIAALSAKTWNNPALAGPYLLVRNDQEAACYLLPVATE